MVTDDQGSAGGSDAVVVAPRSLAELIAESPAGLDAQRVLKWADQLAQAIDQLHADGHVHGGLEAASAVVIDDNDDARLADTSGPTERALLLGDPQARAFTERRIGDVRALAATLYRALGGKASEVSPIQGVSVQVNLVLMSVLSAQPPRISQARQLVGMLRGAPMPEPGPASRATSRVVTRVAAVAALAVTAFGVWRWLNPAATNMSRQVPSGRIGEELRAAEQEIEVAAAAQARRQWEAVASREPPVLDGRLRLEAQELRDAAEDARLLLERQRYDEARAIFQRTTEAFRQVLAEHSEASRLVETTEMAWRDALSASPSQWLDDPDIEAAGIDATAFAQEAAEARDAGRFEASIELYQQAIDRLAAAVVRQDVVTLAVMDEIEGSRAEGRFAKAFELLDKVEPHRDPQEITRQRVETYLALARARNTRAGRDEAGAAVEALLELDPQNQEGLALRSAIVARWEAQSGDILVSSLSQTLVYVAPGEFVMGSPRGGLFHQPGERQHTVRITRGFWMGRVEVTRGQFAAFVEDTGYLTDAESDRWSLGLNRAGRWERMVGLNWRVPGFPQSDNHPVVCVSYHDAQAFCRWLSGKEERTYRLPTEAEWEYACRAGAATAYAWGDDPYEETAHANAADEAWLARHADAVGFRWFDGFSFSSPVASFPANDWGLFDMHGNAQEWCLDVYASYPKDIVIDPTGPPADRDEAAPRVLRGGSFAAPPAHCRTAHRDASRPDARFVTVGFRVVTEE